MAPGVAGQTDTAKATRRCPDCGAAGSPLDHKFGCPLIGAVNQTEDADRKWLQARHQPTVLTRRATREERELARVDGTTPPDKVAVSLTKDGHTLRLHHLDERGRVVAAGYAGGGRRG